MQIPILLCSSVVEPLEKFVMDPNGLDELRWVPDSDSSSPVSVNFAFSPADKPRRIEVVE